MNTTLEQKVDSIIQTNNFILSELIKLNTKIDKVNEEGEETKKEVIFLKTVMEETRIEMKTGFDYVTVKFADMDEGFKNTNETIIFIGNKVFDNHEKRIVQLERDN